jgi:hypothetical protein
MYNGRQAFARYFARGALGEAEKKTQEPGLTFGSFSYERIGFASFATKRS